MRRGKGQRVMIIGGMVTVDGRRLCTVPESYEVSIVDNLCRRQFDDQLGFNSLTPIKSIHEEFPKWKKLPEKIVVR